MKLSRLTMLITVTNRQERDQKARSKTFAVLHLCLATPIIGIDELIATGDRVTVR